MNNSIPLVPLSEVAAPVQRLETPVLGKAYRQIGVKLWGEGAYERESVDGGRTKYKTLSRVEADDIIVNKIWARNGSVALVSEKLAGCYGSNEFPTFTPAEGRLDPRWFHWLTKTRGFWAQCDEKSRGTSGKNRIRPERFLEIEIPLPPLPEQRRILARIEDLAARIEEARGLRRQAVEESDALLTSALAGIADACQSSLGFLGQGIVSARNGLARRPSGDEDGPIVLRLADVSKGMVSLQQPRRGRLSDNEVSKYGLSAGDLLFVRVNGSQDIVGRCVPFLGASETVCFNDHLIRVRLNQKVLDWKFAKTMANAPSARDYIRRTAITTAGQMTINQKMLAGVPIPIPSLAEQRHIVAYFDDLQAKVDSLKRLQAGTTTEFDALLPSILDRAFTGRL